MSTLRLPQSVYDALRAHAEAAYPQECCGVLAGHPGAEGWRIGYAMRAVNVADAAGTRYRIEPAELVRIQGEIVRQGLEIAGFYHSHPDHPAAWSPTDLAEAHWLGCSYVITAVAHGRAQQTHSFRLAGRTEEDKYFEPEAIKIEQAISPAAEEDRRPPVPEVPLS